MAKKPSRNNKPKNALRCATSTVAEAEDRLAQLNEQAKPGTEWKIDTATNRARNLAARGRIHLCQFPKAKPAAKKKPENKTPENDDKPSG